MIRPAGAVRPMTSSLWVSSTTFPEYAPVLMVTLAVEGESVILLLLGLPADVNLIVK